jgi:hypothetical protein
MLRLLSGMALDEISQDRAYEKFRKSNMRSKLNYTIPRSQLHMSRATLNVDTHRPPIRAYENFHKSKMRSKLNYTIPRSQRHMSGTTLNVDTRRPPINDYSDKFRRLCMLMSLILSPT